MLSIIDIYSIIRLLFIVFPSPSQMLNKKSATRGNSRSGNKKIHLSPIKDSSHKKSKSKQNQFVLDCLNSQNSKLPNYNCLKDKYLSYFVVRLPKKQKKFDNPANKKKPSKTSKHVNSQEFQKFLEQKKKHILMDSTNLRTQNNSAHNQDNAVDRQDYSPIKVINWQKQDNVEAEGDLKDGANNQPQQSTQTGLVASKDNQEQRSDLPVPESDKQLKGKVESQKQLKQGESIQQI